MFSEKRQIILLVGSIFLISRSFSLQSTPPFEPILESVESLTNITWSADSATLTFQQIINPEMPPQGPNAQMMNRRYLIQVSETKVPQLSVRDEMNDAAFQQILPHVPVVIHERGNRGLIFLSPDSRFAVYAASEQMERLRRWPLAITDLNTNAFTVIEAITTSAPFTFGDFWLFNWSSDSSAFIAQFNGGFGVDFTYYVRLLDENALFEPIAIPLDELTLNGETLITRIGLGGLSSQGNKAILETFVTLNRSNLVLWNVDQPRQSQVIIEGDESTHFASAGFVNGDKHILYLSNTGLWQYTLETGETRLLDASINGDWVNEAWFSPDGHWMALLDREAPSNVRSSLYVLPVPQ